MAVDIKEARAEMLLNYLYPEKVNRWIADHKGTFYRNYNGDVFRLNDKGERIELSRDGFIRMLPQGLITTDDDLRKGDFASNYKKQSSELEILNETFLPIDSIRFRKSVEVEGKMASILEEKVDYFVGKFTQYVKIPTKDPYVQKILHFLPQIHRYRGDMEKIGDLLSAITGYEVERERGRYSEYERVNCSIPYMKYSLIVENLTNEEFNQLDKELRPLFDFMQQWLVPFDMHVEFKIKHHHQPFSMKKKMTLDYNTEMNQPLSNEITNTQDEY